MTPDEIATAERLVAALAQLSGALTALEGLGLTRSVVAEVAAHHVGLWRDELSLPSVTSWLAVQWRDGGVSLVEIAGLFGSSTTALKERLRVTRRALEAVPPDVVAQYVAMLALVLGRLAPQEISSPDTASGLPPNEDAGYTGKSQ